MTPKKADQNAELMDLYKKHDINPVGGCLPMLLQIPFFYALYKSSEPGTSKCAARNGCG